MWWTSTSNIDLSTLSGSMPWLIVRLPCGSRSTQRTRWPDSAKATARLRVEVVFATPPFWLAKLITLARVPAPRRSALGLRCGAPRADRLGGGDPQLLVASGSGTDAATGGANGRSGPRSGAGGSAAPGSPASGASRLSGSRLELGSSGSGWLIRRPAVDARAPARRRGSGSRLVGCSGERSEARPAVIVGARSAAEKSHRSRLFARTGAFPSPAMMATVCSHGPARQAAGLRHRQGRRRQVDRLPRPRARRRRAPASATILCEVAAQEHLSHVFHRSQVGFHEVELRENLWAISIDPDESMREYVLLQLKVKAMRDLLFRSRIFNYLAAATPGLKELVTIGKIWELTLDDRKARGGQRYDLVDRRRAGDRARGRLPADAADVRQHRPRRPDPPAGRDARPRSSATASGPGSRSSRCPRRCRSTRPRRWSATSPPRSGSTVDRIFCNGLYPERFAEDEIAADRRRGRARGARRRGPPAGRR